MRVYELARELGLESKAVLERAQAIGLDVKTASSGLAGEAVDLLRLELSPALPQPDSEAAEEEDAPATAEAAADVAADEESRAEVRQVLQVPAGVTVGELADLVNRGVGGMVRQLIDMGEMVAAQAPVPPDALRPIVASYGYDVEVVEREPDVGEPAPTRPTKPEFDDPEDALHPRPPVVTVMGHVDHGKTQLLDTIRRSNVIGGEAGGITQHIGAYQVARGDGKITFIDTPGHEAFTSLRARGANVTDIVVLVVAADDGVMPQTVEAINHTKAAGVPMIVAVNKMDLESADPFSVRAQLTEHDVLVEDLGGEVPTVELSALTGDGIDQLLELLDLVAELEEVRANPNAPAWGTVIESQLDKGRGPVATVIVQRGTLRVGDALVAGPVSGRVRAMFGENGEQVEEAGPSTPALVMGWGEVPSAGDFFSVTVTEKEARSVAEKTARQLRSAAVRVPTAQERLAELLDQLRSDDVTDLRIVVKADAHGSLEAIRDAVGKIRREDASISIVHAAVGGVTENDIKLAEASEALVFGFNVRPDGPARRAAERAGIDIRTYRIIYELLDDIEQILVGRLAPEQESILLGVADVRATFRAPRYGTVAGCYVTEGQMLRNARVRLVRDGVVVYDGSIGSLRRFKDDVTSVASGFECGIGLVDFRDIKEGDTIESYEVREVTRT